MTCPAPPADAPFVSSLADYLDCHASALGQNGFEGAANGFFMPAMLTGCLTIFVALIGYRLILGERYTVREAVLACIRVGLIITFCTRWPSYDAVFYRTVVEGPQEIAGQMLQSSGLPLLNGADLAGRLQQDYDAIQQSVIKFPAEPPSPSTEPSAFPPVPAPGAVPPQLPNATQQANPAPTATSFSVAGLVFLISTIGSLLAVHLAAGVLMAIGPLVLLLALFDSLVGLLENWMAALAGTMLATAGITIVTELELGFVESRLSQFRPNGAPVLTDQALYLTALLFSLCIVGVVVAAGMVGRRLKFRGLGRFGHDHEARPALISGPSTVSATVRSSGIAVAPPSRALAVANAVREEGRRERLQLAAMVSASPTLSGATSTSRSEPVAGASIAVGSTGIGYSLRRPASFSRSISHGRRGRRL